MIKAKKTLAVFIVLSLFTCSFLSVSAQTLQQDSYYIFYDNTAVQPRLKYFGTVSSGVSIKSGNIVGTGDYTSFATGIDVTLIVAVEKQTGSTWTQVQSTTRTYSPGKGGNILSTTYKNPSTGTYRAITTAMAINSSGNILEIIKVPTAKTVKI